MTAGFRGAFALIAWCVLGLGASAAEREVRVRLLPDIARDLPALPRISDPVDEAERKVNLALDRLDASVRKAARDCRREGRGQASWERMVGVPIAARGFLSIYFVDNAYCGGAHPSYGTAAIVYDVRSGGPADWTKLLPAALAGEVSLTETSDGSKMTTLSSARLHQLYLDSYRPKNGDAAEDADDRACREAVTTGRDGKPPAMIVWLKGPEGLSVQFDLEHAVQACADEVTISTATLRAEGASAEFLQALEAARPAQIRR